uniref:Putative mitochondrial import receptor subunit TOM40 homolog n=1 Tax=Schistosoma japonicum TaxID=6182 RepID=C1L6E8_SCHJA|nr:putative mitochondrial import receptor subunit TOM40 homolog [Schistosoma japonicum]
MGNAVHASNSKGDVFAEPEPTKPQDNPSNEGPGTVENIHNKAHDIFPVPFEGARLVVNKGLSPNFQVNHSLSLNSDEQCGYRFGVTYVGHNKVSDTESYPVLMSELQPNGNMQAQIIHRMFPSIYVRYIAQLQRHRFGGQQACVEYRKPKVQASLTLINPDINRSQCMAALDVMRQITKRLALGSAFFYQCSPQLPAGQDGVFSFGAKYATSHWQGSATVRPWQNSLHSSFHIQVNDSLQLAAEFESNYQQQSNTTTLGYKYDIPKANVTFKAQMDSNWNIASSLEKKLTPFPFTFSLCAMCNQVKSKYSFGIGLMVG